MKLREDQRGHSRSRVRLTRMGSGDPEATPLSPHLWIWDSGLKLHDKDCASQGVYGVDSVVSAELSVLGMGTFIDSAVVPHCGG